MIASPQSSTPQLSVLKPGDWVTLAAGVGLVAALFGSLWQSGQAQRAIIRSGGKLFAEVDLARNQELVVPGPLGESRITIQDRRARVASDPSPRQYCVQRGWLSSPGEVAVCLPNQVSVELAGSSKRYDSLSY